MVGMMVEEKSEEMNWSLLGWFWASLFDSRLVGKKKKKKEKRKQDVRVKVWVKLEEVKMLIDLRNRSRMSRWTERTLVFYERLDLQLDEDEVQERLIFVLELRWDWMKEIEVDWFFYLKSFAFVSVWVYESNYQEWIEVEIVW